MHNLKLTKLRSEHAQVVNPSAVGPTLVYLQISADVPASKFFECSCVYLIMQV